MRTLKLLSGLLFLGLSSGCMSAVMGPPPEQAAPGHEEFYGLPDGFTSSGCLAIRDELLHRIANAPVGQVMTFYMADNQSLVVSFTVPKGSPKFREKLAKVKLAKVWEILDPEKTDGDKSIDLISLPATIRKYRKTDLPPHVFLIGDPMVKDREQGLDIGKEFLPCDGCVLDSSTSYGRMDIFPDGTKIKWLIPRSDYGNGPNHRTQVEHFLGLLVQTKSGKLVRMSSDPEVIFNSEIESQWADELEPQDECNGLKAVAPDDDPKRFTNDGHKIVDLGQGVEVTDRSPEIDQIEGPLEQVLFLVDVSMSVQEHFPRMAADVCEKLQSMPMERFAICGFGGTHDLEARLELYPRGIFTGLKWAEATPQNREQASKFVKNLFVSGGTPTLEALEQIENLDGAITVLLYTDGIPTIGTDSQPEVIQFVSDLVKDREIAINTIGVGALSTSNDDFDYSGAYFLGLMAKRTGGAYFALADKK